MEQHHRGTPIDVTFDMRSDAGGRDPDSYSPTLRRYHQLLWSKPLPNGVVFDLVTDRRHSYLHHESKALGRFDLSSDTIVHSLASFSLMRDIIEQVPDYVLEEIRRHGQTIAGHIVFPGNVVDRKATINAARGFHPRIRDRWDLTLECIRRHYAGVTSPLAAVLERYDDFFALFDDFTGYVEFFHLQDLVTSDGRGVQFYLPFDDFRTSAFPTSLDQYWQYRDRTLEFIAGRNRRIDAWARENL